MQVRSLDNINCPHSTVVALGTFDGLHLGHQAVIQAACRQTELTPVVFSVIPPHTTELLLPRLQQEQLLNQMGVHTWLPVPLTDIRLLSPQDFFRQILINTLHANHLVCGFNFRFGQNATGDIACLQHLCRKHHVALTVVEPVTHQGIAISSSRIRLAIKEGELALANEMLGRPFGFTASVVSGQQLGHRLGFPTINQPIPSGLVIPKPGVYAAKILFGSSAHWGVCNLGKHPTVGALTTPLAETHILDFSQDLYDCPVELQLLQFLREEQTFSSLQALQAAVARDIEQVQNFIQQ